MVSTKLQNTSSDNRKEKSIINPTMNTIKCFRQIKITYKK